MLDQYYTTVWDASTSHTIPIRNATVEGTLITVKYHNHFLSTGDIVHITTESGYEAFAGTFTVTVKTESVFTFDTATPPGRTLSAAPGQSIKVTLRCPKYSALLNKPGVVRILPLNPDQRVDVQTNNGDGWITHRTLVQDDGLTHLIYLEDFKFARLAVSEGGGVVTAIAYHSTAPGLDPSPTITYYIPESGAGGVGPPGPEGPPGPPGPAGPPGADGTINTYKTLMNSSGSIIYKGQPVCLSGPGTITLALGDNSYKSVIGLAAENITPSTEGPVIITGVLTASTAEWDMVTGSTGGLLANSNPYFLNFTTAGSLVNPMNISLAPAGAFLVAVGSAISSTDFVIEIDPPIKI